MTTPGSTFPLEVQPRIPGELSRLEEMANDLMYSWDRSIRSLFHRLDRNLWDACGHNPKAPRFTAYPAGPNSAGALHWGINYTTPSNHMRRVVPNWEEPPLHQDLVTFDTTVTLGNVTLIDNGFLMALKSDAVVEAAAHYGDPVELLEGFVE